MIDHEKKPRILVVDDEPTITEFLETGLHYEGFDVRVVADGVMALNLAREFVPDLVVLDLMLPSVDGVEVCRRLRSESDVGILVLTARDDLDDRVAGLESGADDYLVKPFKWKELLARVRAILRRRRTLMPQQLHIGTLRLDHDTRLAWHGDEALTLTPREFELLGLLMRHPRQVLSRETILNRVWGYQYIGETNVVEVHISALRDKLQDRDRRIIQTVRGVGYIFRGEP